MGNVHSQNYVLQNNYTYTYGYIPHVQLYGPGPNLVKKIYFLKIFQFKGSLSSV